MMMTFSPISKITASVYDVGDLVVNSCVMVFLITFVLLNFLSVQLIEKWGLKICVSNQILVNFHFSSKLLRLAKYLVRGADTSHLNTLMILGTY